MIEKIASFLFRKRFPLLVSASVITLFLGYHASQLKIETDFSEMIPLTHEYIRNYEPFKKIFGGGNQIKMEVSRKDKTIVTAEFLKKLRIINEDVMFVKGVNRLTVRSLVSPETRYMIVNEMGFDSGPIVPPFIPETESGLSQILKNIDLGHCKGRLVSHDLKSALITAEIYETGVDYLSVYRQLNGIRDKYSDNDVSIHITGFAMVNGFVHDALPKIIALFGLSILITFIILCRIFHFLKIAVLPMLCGGLAVLWSLGIAQLTGINLDPMTTIVPFLVLAIGSSHGIQMVKRFLEECEKHPEGYDAALNALASLIIPGTVALSTDAIGFITILFVPIGVIQSLAIMSAAGVLCIIVINVLVLTLSLSYYPNLCSISNNHKAKVSETPANWLLTWIATLTYGKNAYRVVIVSCVLLVIGLFASGTLTVGDVNPGEPLLWEDSTYNQDASKIMSDFMLGVDTLSVVATGEEDGTCKVYDVLNVVEDYEWEISHVEGVTFVLSPLMLAGIFNRMLHEDDIRWHALPKTRIELANIMMNAGAEDDSEFMNMGCQSMNIRVFMSDHKGDTIRRVIGKTKEFIASHPMPGARFVLAGSNVGIMAATNEQVAAAQVPMLLLIYISTISLCIIFFKSIKAAFYIVTPLFLVSVLATAFMKLFGLGLNINTLPVSSLGVGIGVDYGIYIYSRLIYEMKDYPDFGEAIDRTLRTTGAAVFYTALTLSVGVLIWYFSDLKFQADMGLLLGFIFIANMIGAMVLMPALVYILGFKRMKAR